MSSDNPVISMYETITIKEGGQGGGGFKPEAGTLYNAIFQGFEETTNKAGKPCLKWTFMLKNDPSVTLLGFCEPSTATAQNKFGKWLCGLAGKPLQAGVSLKAEEFIGQEYVLIYDINQKGTTALSMISKVQSA